MIEWTRLNCSIEWILANDSIIMDDVMHATRYSVRYKLNILFIECNYIMQLNGIGNLISITFRAVESEGDEFNDIIRTLTQKYPSSK